MCNLNDPKPATSRYLCPPLADALRVLATMPNTSQDDVNTLLQTLLDETKGVTRDLQRSAVRTLLFEASPAFADERA